MEDEWKLRFVEGWYDVEENKLEEDAKEFRWRMEIYEDPRLPDIIRMVLRSRSVFEPFDPFDSHPDACPVN